MPNPDFKLERAKECSFAIKFIFLWITAMYDFNKVYLATQPLRDELEKQNKIVSLKMAQLAVKKEELA